MKIEEPKRAGVGESITIKSVEAPFHEEVEHESFIIKPSCGEDSPHTGRWVCVEHGTIFGNQMNKDSHIHQKPSEHTLAWWCPKCVQYEVP